MWTPPKSPHSLIQEDLWPDAYKILVVCQMLNCTTRKQVEKVLDKFFDRWPDAESLAAAEQAAVSDVIASLGFKNRRAKNLVGMARKYIEGGWSDSRDLPGVGEYAGRAHDIFIRGIIGDVPPKDHALVQYWQFLKDRGM